MRYESQRRQRDRKAGYINMMVAAFIIAATVALYNLAIPSMVPDNVDVCNLKGAAKFQARGSLRE